MKIRAFVFDDDEAVRLLLSIILQERGYEVHAFSEPGACPLFLDSPCPCPLGYTCADIIITDINMPNITGLEFIENQIKHGCKVKNFAVISGYWSDSKIKHAIELGCMIFNKSFEEDKIIDWLKQCENRIDQDRKLWGWFNHKKEKV